MSIPAHADWSWEQVHSTTLKHFVPPPSLAPWSCTWGSHQYSSSLLRLPMFFFMSLDFQHQATCATTKSSGPAGLTHALHTTWTLKSVVWVGEINDAKNILLKDKLRPCIVKLAAVVPPMPRATNTSHHSVTYILIASFTYVQVICH